jgi:hypothetical protein
MLLSVIFIITVVDCVSANTTSGLPSSQKLPPDVVGVIVYPPANLQTITRHDFERARAQAAAQSGLNRIPSPGQSGYWKLKIRSMKTLLDKSWIEGQAVEMAIYVTPKEVATELSQIKRENFRTAADYKRFLKASHLTRRDARELVKLQMLSTAIEARVVRGSKGRKVKRRVLARFTSEYFKRWRSRTVCAPGYVFGRCSNEQGNMLEASAQG